MNYFLFFLSTIDWIFLCRICSRDRQWFIQFPRMCGDRTKFLCAAGGGLGGQERRAAAPLPPANCTNILVQLSYSSSATAACPACPAQIRCGSGERRRVLAGGEAGAVPPRAAAPCLSILIIPVMSACPPALGGTGHPGPKLRLGDTNSLTGDRVQANLQIIYYWVSKFSGFWLYVGTCCPLPG